MQIHKATVRSFDADAHTATVQITGSLATWLDGVPVARNIPASARHRGPPLRRPLLRPRQPLGRGRAGGVRVAPCFLESGAMLAVYHSAFKENATIEGEW